jgi:hypothetical protein
MYLLYSIQSQVHKSRSSICVTLQIDHLILRFQAEYMKWTGSFSELLDGCSPTLDRIRHGKEVLTARSKTWPALPFLFDHDKARTEYGIVLITGLEHYRRGEY